MGPGSLLHISTANVHTHIKGASIVGTRARDNLQAIRRRLVKSHGTFTAAAQWGPTLARQCAPLLADPSRPASPQTR